MSHLLSKIGNWVNAYRYSGLPAGDPVVSSTTYQSLPSAADSLASYPENIPPSAPPLPDLTVDTYLVNPEKIPLSVQHGKREKVARSRALNWYTQSRKITKQQRTDLVNLSNSPALALMDPQAPHQAITSVAQTMLAAVKGKSLHEKILHFNEVIAGEIYSLNISDPARVVIDYTLRQYLCRSLIEQEANGNIKFTAENTDKVLSLSQVKLQYDEIRLFQTASGLYKIDETMLVHSLIDGAFKTMAENPAVFLTKSALTDFEELLDAFNRLTHDVIDVVDDRIFPSETKAVLKNHLQVYQQQQLMEKMTSALIQMIDHIPNEISGKVKNWLNVIAEKKFPFEGDLLTILHPALLRYLESEKPIAEKIEKLKQFIPEVEKDYLYSTFNIREQYKAPLIAQASTALNQVFVQEKRLPTDFSDLEQIVLFLTKDQTTFDATIWKEGTLLLLSSVYAQLETQTNELPLIERMKTIRAEIEKIAEENSENSLNLVFCCPLGFKFQSQLWNEIQTMTAHSYLTTGLFPEQLIEICSQFEKNFPWPELEGEAVTKPRALLSILFAALSPPRFHGDFQNFLERQINEKLRMVAKQMLPDLTNPSVAEVDRNALESLKWASKVFKATDLETIDQPPRKAAPIEFEQPKAAILLPQQPPVVPSILSPLSEKDFPLLAVAPDSASQLKKAQVIEVAPSIQDAVSSPAAAQPMPVVVESRREKRNWVELVVNNFSSLTMIDEISSPSIQMFVCMHIYNERKSTIEEVFDRTLKKSLKDNEYASLTRLSVLYQKVKELKEITISTPSICASGDKETALQLIEEYYKCYPYPEKIKAFYPKLQNSVFKENGTFLGFVYEHARHSGVEIAEWDHQWAEHNFFKEPYVEYAIHALERMYATAP